MTDSTHQQTEDNTERTEGAVNEKYSPPQSVKEAMKNAKNVTGAEFTAPHDLDGYLDEPVAKFGLWVGESEEEAELQTFEITGEKIQELAKAFNRQAEEAKKLKNTEDEQ